MLAGHVQAVSVVQVLAARAALSFYSRTRRQAGPDTERQQLAALNAHNPPACICLWDQPAIGTQMA